MNKMPRILLLCAFCSAPSLFADRVTLISGEQLEGEILTEDARELVFETARTRSRSHRIVHHLSHDVISKVTRGNPRPEIMDELATGGFTDASAEEVEPVYDLLALKDALQKRSFLDEGEYDQAADQYKKVSEYAYNATKAETNLTAKSELLTIQQNAYELWIVALDGKVDALKEREKNIEESVENAVDIAQTNLEMYQDRIADQERSSNRNSGKTIRLGSNRTAEKPLTPTEKALVAHLDRAKQRMAQFDGWRRTNGEAISGLEAESDLLDEKSRQVKNEIAQVKRDLRTQERIRR